MKLLIDMNLSLRWVGFINAAGIAASHWSTMGAANAADSEIMAFALADNCTILIQDLDFGILLATLRRSRQSVVQLRTDDVSPEDLGSLVIRAINQVSPDLENGALLTIDPKRARLRLLPLRHSKLPTERD